MYHVTRKTERCTFADPLHFGSDDESDGPPECIARSFYTQAIKMVSLYCADRQEGWRKRSSILEKVILNK